jgi:hypothetical protein
VNTQPLSAPNFRAFIVRFLVLALTGALTGAAVTAEITPILLFVAGSGGGYLASVWYEHFNQWDRLGGMVYTWYTRGNRLQRGIAWLLAEVFFEKRTAALTVFIMATLLSGGATAVLAFFSGATLSGAWSALVAFIASQALYMYDRFTKDEPVTASLPTNVDGTTAEPPRSDGGTRTLHVW